MLLMIFRNFCLHVSFSFHILVFLEYLFSLKYFTIHHKLPKSYRGFLCPLTSSPGTASHMTRVPGHLVHVPIFPYTCVLAALCNFTCPSRSHHNRTQDRGLHVTTETPTL